MKRSFTLPVLLLATLAVAVYLSGCNNAQHQQPIPVATANSHPNIVNIVNFIRLLEPRDSAITQQVLYETVVKQVEMLRQNKLPGTFLLQYDALIDPRYQRLLKSLPADSFEIGAWWEIPQPLVEKAGLPWRGRYPWDWRATLVSQPATHPANVSNLPMPT